MNQEERIFNISIKSKPISKIFIKVCKAHLVNRLYSDPKGMLAK